MEGDGDEGDSQEVVEPVEADASVEDNQDTTKLQGLREHSVVPGIGPGRPVAPGDRQGGGHDHGEDEARVRVQPGRPLLDSLLSQVPIALLGKAKEGRNVDSRT